MSDRKSFLLRIDERVLEAVKRWADQDLRSLNAQVEYLLRDSLRRSGRLPSAPNPDAPNPDTPNPEAPNPEAPNPDAPNPDAEKHADPKVP